MDRAEVEERLRSLIDKHELVQAPGQMVDEDEEKEKEEEEDA